MKFKTLLTVFFCLAASLAMAAPLRLLYWNFQNGMWEGQADDYAKFVAWVKAYDPDICVWCEGESLYKTGTAEVIADPEGRHLPAHLPELAARYGHAHTAVAAHRDSYPQLITSKYTIETIRKIAGTPYSRDVIHGAGWFRVSAPGRDVNVVTLHLAPMAHDPNVAFADRQRSAEAGGGDRYRKIEMEEILAATVASSRAAVGDWVMLGDFNSVSRTDAALYRYPTDSTKYLVHDFIAAETDYVDILAKTRPNPEDRATVAAPHRIDYVYVSPSLASETKDAGVVRDAFTKQTPVEGIPGFYHPSDHLPILVDFDLKPLPSLDPCLEYASAELATYAYKLTGRPLPAGLVTLSVDSALGEQAFRLRETGGRLSITGGDAPGVLYGVYEYLERHCGVRWYAKFCEKVPRLAAMPVPKGLDDTQRPAFRMRTADWYDVSHDPDFAARLRLNGELLRVLPRHGGAHYRFGRDLGSCHTMNSLVDPEKLFFTHPEYFAEWEGKRDWDEHCFTNPDVFRLTLAGVLERMRKDPHARWYGVSQNDTDKHCQCAACAAVNAEEGSPAGTLVRFVNAIAAEVEKEFPDAVIETLAYRYSSKPPKKTKLRRNVMPCFCTFECEFANPMATSALPANRAIAADIAGWKAMMAPGSDVYVWDYTTCFPNYLMPFPNVRTIRENCRFFRDCGATCLYEQGGCQGRHAEFAELKAWLTAKWLWNPDAPYDELVDDFMNGYYGKAAPLVRRYFDKAQALAKTFDPLKNPLRINIDPRVSVDPRTMGLTEAFLDEGEAIFKEALGAVADDPSSWWHVRLTALTIDYCRARREGPNRARYIRELRKAMAYVKAMDDGVIRLSNGAGALKDKKIQQEFDDVVAADSNVNPHDYTVFLPTAEKQVNEHFLVLPNPKTGRLLAFWTQESWEGSSDMHIMFARSEDGGRSWSEARLLWGSPKLNSGVPNAVWPVPMVSRSGRLYCVWNQREKAGGGMGVGLMMGACSDDDGETWSGPVKLMDAKRWCVWQRPMRLTPDGKYLTAVSIADEHLAKTCFIRFENVDDDPDAKDLKFTLLGEDKTLDGEEASIVKLPDGRLFAVMRSRFGVPLWTMSKDGGTTWSDAKAVMDASGRVVRHPRAPCPLYDLAGDAAASGRYAALFTDAFDPKIGQWAGRGPLYRYDGTFDPKGGQPVRFTKGPLLMPRDARSHYGNSCYSSYTSVNGEGVLWYPDNKRRLYGVRMTGPEQKGNER